MFKLGLSFLATLLLASNINATIARMTALGQDSEIGSFYLHDTRNVFHNAAHLNHMSDYVLAEWLDQATGTSGTGGEGGYFKSAGSLNYGVYFGADVEQRTQNAQRSSNSYTQSDDLLDFFLAGGDSVKWGVRLNYGKNKLSSGENAVYGAGLGIDGGNYEVFANLDIANESELSTGNKMEGKFGYQVGGNFEVMDWTAWVVYNSFGYEIKPTTGTTTERETMKVQVGAGKVHKVNNTSRVITDIEYFYQDQEDKTTTTVDTKTRGLNVNVGFEADATSWLTWRGSVRQDLTAEVFGSRETAETTINAGSTLNFGKLKVDGTIGYGSGKVGSNDFLGQVGVHYWF